MSRSSIPSGPAPQYEKVVSGYETFHSSQPFACDWGGVLPEVNLAWESWGELSPARDNAVLLHTGLSASSHARSQERNPNPGWWEDMVGPGLAYQGDKFCLQYDPNSYLYISKAMDLFDITAVETSSKRAPSARISDIKAPALIIGVKSDILFPVWQQRELAALLEAETIPVTYVELDSPYGHDTFLLSLIHI